MATQRALRAALLSALPLLIFLFCPTAIYGQAPTDREGNVLFTPPQGWQRVNQEGAVVFIPTDRGLSAANCFIAILPGQDLDSDFRAWFDEFLKRAQSGLRVIKGGEVTASDTEEGYPILYTALVTEDAKGERSYRFYLGAHPGKRGEVVTYVAIDPEAYQKNFPVFEAFLKSVDFASRNAAPTAPNKDSERPAPNGSAKPRASSSNSSNLEGLYVGTESRQQFNPNTKFYDYIVRQVYYLFLPDGRVYFALPKGGALRDFDFESARREEPNSCGFYRITGDQIVLQRPGANGQPVPFKRNQGSVQIGRTVCYRVDSFDGLRLEGTYSIRTFTNTSAGNNTGGVSGERTIIFRSDGRFSEQGFVGFTSSTPNVGAASSSGNSGSGTYRVFGNTLELTYSNGGRRQFTFFIYPENIKEPRPGLIVIDGAAFLLR